MELNGISAIVTGGASGLGAATARRLSKQGAKVTLFDLNQEQGARIAGEIGGIFVKVDVTDEASVTSGLDQAEKVHGAPRLLVNCAGIAIGEKTVNKGQPHSLASFIKVVTINLIGTFNCIRLAAARMTALDALPGGERGVIVCTASVAAFEGQIGQVAYAASKGGVHAMTIAIARDLARDGIRICTIAPGLFLTPMLEGLPEEVQKSLAVSVPFPPRLGKPSEYAQLVQQIVENEMLNGETIRLDGALRMAPK